MNIWIINEYAGSPYHGMVYRHYYLAREFVKLGHKVTIISGAYSHKLFNLPHTSGKFSIELIDSITYVWVKTVQYQKSLSAMRMLKWVDFALSLLFLPGKKLDDPDFIICSPTAPVCTVPSYILAKRYSAKFLFEVRDIWPLTLIQLGGFSRKNPLIVVMDWFERYGIRKADRVVSVLENYDEYLREDKKMEITPTYIPNGVYQPETIPAHDIESSIKAALPEGKFLVGYTGSIGNANAVDVFVKAAKILHDEKQDEIFFLVVGNGSEKGALQEYVKENGLSNILFLDAIHKEQIQPLLSKLGACYIGLKNEDIFKYGVSPNKLFDYMLSGKPIIYSVPGEANIVQQSGCGITAKAEDPVSVSEAIKTLFRETNASREAMGVKGKQFVYEHHSYGVIAQKYLAVLESL